MTPNFALSLSFDGLTLLRRVPGGWAEIAETALDVPDMATAMAGLRETAQSLDPDGDAVLLVLPNEQIRYLDTPDPGSKRAEAARAALEGATPYAIDDLAADYSIAGGRLLVAAVARETLEEAEAFATQHGFRPVACVARAPEGVFHGTVFFGAAETWDGARPTRPSGVMTRVAADAAAMTPVAPPKAEASAKDDEADRSDADAAAKPNAVEAEKDKDDPAKPVSFASRRAGEGAAPAPAAPSPAPRTHTPRFSAAAPDKGAEGEKEKGRKTAKAATKGKHADAPQAASKAEPTVPKPAEASRAASPALGASSEPGPAKTPASQPANVAKPVAAPTQPPFNPADASLEGGLLARLSRSGPSPSPKQKPIIAPQGLAPGQDGGASAILGARQSRLGLSPGALASAALLLALLIIAGASVLLWPSADDADTALAPVSEEVQPPIAAPAPTEPAPAERATLAPEAPTVPSVDEDPVVQALPDVAIDPAPPEDETIAALDDSAEPPAPEITAPTGMLDPQEAAATYAATGIWQRAPDAPAPLDAGSIDSVYIASLDPGVTQFDAVALPPTRRAAPAPEEPGLPPPPGLTFDFDDRGLVRATPEGALTPDGLRIFSGPPPESPPLRRNALPESVTGPPPLTLFDDIRPEPRPSDLIESRERAIFGGLTRAELAQLRPVPRSESAQERALAQAGLAATDAAVARSLVPTTRPQSMAEIVATARAAAAERAPTAAAPAQVQTAAARVPDIPTTAEVARAATQTNAVRLANAALFGIYGTEANRRALVRLPSGNYEKVTVGDRLDGGSVVAIGDESLVYQRAGRTITLEMPRG